MAKYFKTLLILACTLLFSCQEGGEAGDLLGQWHMKGSDSLYLSFSGSVTRLLSVGEAEVFGNFQHPGDSLFIQCYSITCTETDTTVVENKFGFRPFNDIRLKIEALDADQLVLSKDGHTWSLDKY